MFTKEYGVEHFVQNKNKSTKTVVVVILVEKTFRKHGENSLFFSIVMFGAI